MMFRRLPPAAAPLKISDLTAGLQFWMAGKPARENFEHVLAKRFGALKTLAVASGRTALRTILEMIKETPQGKGRSEVIIPAYTCPVLVVVIRDAGLKPVLCDLDAEEMDFTRSNLDKLTNHNTLAIIHVHPFGLPRRREFVNHIASKSGAFVIEDICQSLGATENEQPLRSRGGISFTSFGPGKPISLGGGGAIFLYDQALADSTLKIAHGENKVFKLTMNTRLEAAIAWTRLAILDCLFRPTGWRLTTLLGLQKMGDRSDQWGYRLQWLSESQARVGVRALMNLDNLNQHRQQIAKAYQQGLENCAGIEQVELAPDTQPIFLRFPVLIKKEEQRQAIYQSLWANGIGVGKMYQQPLTGWFSDLEQLKYPGAEAVARQLLTLPTHHFIHEQDIQHVVTLIKRETYN